MIVIDASAVLELVLDTRAGRRVADRLRVATSFHAPHLVDLEVAQVLRRLAAAGQLSARDADAALSAFGALDLSRYAHTPFLPRVWQLRANLSAYDAAYVALAETLAAPLITADARLANAPGHDAVVELVAIH